MNAPYVEDVVKNFKNKNTKYFSWWIPDNVKLSFCNVPPPGIWCPAQQGRARNDPARCASRTIITKLEVHSHPICVFAHASKQHIVQLARLFVVQNIKNENTRFSWWISDNVKLSFCNVPPTLFI